MKSRRGKWTFEELNKFLAGPQMYIPDRDDLFGNNARPGARRCDRLSADTVGQPSPSAKAKEAPTVAADQGPAPNAH